ncbi:MAG TPA: TIGR00725 family protein [Acidobacteriota bacterium]|nr:TIGR00725 family protein [Acidobacteriota bacterium]
MAVRPPMIAVCGGGKTDPRTAALAEAVGRDLAAAGAVVVCGGLGGVMEAACRGAKQRGGITVGIVPGTRTDAANAYVDIPIASGMADGRNAVIVHTADGVIALPGKFGTLSEIALALKMGKPVVSVGGWAPDPSVRNVDNAEDAVTAILRAVRT